VTASVVFRPRAAEEARAARRWYEEQKPGLGARFADALDETLQRIVSSPSAFPLVHGEIRRAVVRQFPYGVYFRAHAHDLVVIAVMHGRRHPRRWQSRRS
jgi:plasmid stabilization system protein ParE